MISRLVLGLHPTIERRRYNIKPFPLARRKSGISPVIFVKWRIVKMISNNVGLLNYLKRVPEVTMFCISNTTDKHIPMHAYHHIPYEDFGARSRYLKQVKVITAHRILWGSITYPYLRYLLVAPKSPYIYIQISQIEAGKPTFFRLLINYEIILSNESAKRVHNFWIMPCEWI